MNRDDITRMAREAGCVPVRHPEYDNDVQVFATPDVLERFAALVAAAERERVTFEMVDEAQRAVQESVAAEREACAKLCDERGQGRYALEHYAALTYVGATHDCAVAIRARGEMK